MLRARLTKTTSTLALATAASALFAGCGTGAEVGSAPSPTWSCTPDTSGEPCTPEKAAAQQEEAEAYAEAMHAYREFTKERVRLLGVDEGPTVTPILEQYATGRYLEVMQRDIREARERRLHITGDVVLTDLGLQNVSSSTVTFFACEDAGEVYVFSQDGEVVGRGSLGVQIITATSSGDQWKISDSAETEERTCPTV